MALAAPLVVGLVQAVSVSSVSGVLLAGLPLLGSLGAYALLIICNRSPHYGPRRVLLTGAVLYSAATVGRIFLSSGLLTPTVLRLVQGVAIAVVSVGGAQYVSEENYTINE